MAFLTIGVWAGYQADDALNRLTGWTGTSELSQHLAIIASLTALEVMLLHWHLPPEAARSESQWRYILALGVAVGMVGLFLLGGPDARPATEGAYYRATPTVAIHESVYALLLAAATTDLAVQSGIYRRWLRDYPYSWWGLTAFAVAGWLALPFALLSGIDAAAEGLGLFEVSSQLLAATESLILTACALFAVGAVLPTAGPRIAAGVRRVRRARAAQKLRPLWQAVLDGNPGLALDRPRGADSAGEVLRTLISGDDWRVYRRVIEVRDGYLELRPWLDQDVMNLALFKCQQAGLTGHDLHAAVEAAVIAAALRAKDRADQPREGTHVDPGGADMSGEIRWLARVSQHLRHPVVREVLHELDLRRESERSWVDQQLDKLGIKR